MKRFVAMLLALLMLFGGVGMADEDLNAIVQRLEGYLDTLRESEGNGVDTTALEECMVLLKETKNRKKKPLELYCSVLLSIERNQFDEANGNMFVLRKESMSKPFEEDFVESSGGDTPISTVEQLYNYLKGREAEHEGSSKLALEFYDECLNAFDTYARTENIKYELYDSAMNLYGKGEYEQARSLLEKLDQMQYPEAVRALKDFSTPTPKPISVPALTLAVGDYLEFGHYPQTADGKDNTPIEWLVLEKDGETALLLSRYALDSQPYNTMLESITWERCTLRSWLNNEFYNRAFSAKEKKSIVKSNISADGNPSYSTNPGNATEDNIFLLSIVEAQKYFNSDKARMCTATDYAIEMVAYWRSSDEIDGGNTCWWVLRSPGDYGSRAAFITTSGFINAYGHSVCGGLDAVRPCMRVRLDDIDVARYMADDTAHSSESVNKSTQPEKLVVEYVTFGNYPQTATGDDNTPIEWIVLERDGESALLLSRYGLEEREYNEEMVSEITWEQCTLREWLNDEFYNRAFSQEEKQYIIKSDVSAGKNPSYPTNPGNATKDNVFLLSIVEAETYLLGSEAGLCSPSDYVIAHNWFYSIIEEEKWDNAWWWLRSPGGCNSSVACARYFYDDLKGLRVDHEGSHVHERLSVVVRPCIRVRVS